jgi:hypothetical protein
MTAAAVTTASLAGGRTQSHSSYTPTPVEEERFVCYDCPESQRPRYYSQGIADRRHRPLRPYPSRYSMNFP